MRIIDWNAQDDAARQALLRRPAFETGAAVREAAQRIIAQVRADGDSTLRALTRRFDGCELARFEATPDEFEQALRANLVNAVVPTDQVLAKAEEYAERIARHPLIALRIEMEASMRGMDMRRRRHCGEGRP